MSDLKIEYLPIESIKPYEKNPRKIDKAVDYVANSIQEFGFKVPIVLDRKNIIVCGHVRYKAAKKLKLESVPCIVADDLTQEQIDAFRLIDNKTQELSTWDFSKLIEELDELTDIFNMSQLGFNEPRKTGPGSDEREQDLDDSEELDIGGFGDDQFACECPNCGFRFND